MNYSKGFLELMEEERAKEKREMEREDAAHVQGSREVAAPQVGATNRTHDGGRKLDPEGNRQRASRVFLGQEQPGEAQGRSRGNGGVGVAPQETGGKMTVTEALIRARDLLQENKDRKSAIYSLLDRRTEEAIGKLMALAFDTTFKKTTPRLVGKREEENE